jgi:prevent-host-death family protein
MREIEVGELKAQLDSVLREVEDGETVRVTSDGRPIAEIVPAEPPDAVGERTERSEAMKRLIAKGKVTPGDRSRPRRKARPRETGISGAAIILAEREEER